MKKNKLSRILRMSCDMSAFIISLFFFFAAFSPLWRKGFLDRMDYVVSSIFFILGTAVILGDVFVLNKRKQPKGKI